MKQRFLLIFIFLLPAIFAHGISRQTLKSGSWSDPSIWFPAGVPDATDDITIQSSHDITIDQQQSHCRSLVIQTQGLLNIPASTNLSIHHTEGLKTFGTLNIDEGDITLIQFNSVFMIAGTGTVIWNPFKNTIQGASLFTNGRESFAPTSTLVLKKWWDLQTDPGQVIRGGFGHLEIHNIQYWNLNNCLEKHPVAGKLTLTDAQVTLDTTGTIHHTQIGSIELTTIGSTLVVYDGSANADFTLSTQEIDITSGAFILSRGNHTGTSKLQVLHNMTVTSSGCFIGAKESDDHVNVAIGGDLTLSRSQFFGVWGGQGNATIQTGGHLNLQLSGNVRSEFYAIVDGNGNASLTVGGNFTNVGYASLIWNTGVTGTGNGNGTMRVAGSFTQSDGDFRGIWNGTTTNAGSCRLDINELYFSGGVFMGTYSCGTNSDTIELHFGPVCSIQFSRPTDIFRGIGMATLTGMQNTQVLYFSSDKEFTIQGNATAEFGSSYAYGHEWNEHLGMIRITGGNNKFGGTPHDLNFRCAHLLINGGNTYLAYSEGSTTFETDSLKIQQGQLVLRNNTGSGYYSVRQTFRQSGGNLTLYGNASVSSSDTTLLVVGGDFIQSGGQITFSTKPNLTGITLLRLSGSRAILDGTGKFTSAYSGIASHFGTIEVEGAGTLQKTIVLNKTSATHLTEQVKYIIKNNTTARLTGKNFQIASHQQKQPDMILVEPEATLQADTTIILPNGLATYSGISLYGTLATGHTGGLYNATASATIAAVNQTDYFLYPGSTVVYNGKGVQTISGYGFGTANGEQHKYANLRIDSPDLMAVLNKDVQVRQTTTVNNGKIRLNKRNFYTGDLIAQAGGGFLFEEKTAVVSSQLIIGRTGIYGTGFSSASIPVTDTCGHVARLSISSVSNPGQSLLYFKTRQTSSNNAPLPGNGYTSAVTSLNPDGTDLSVTQFMDRYYEISAAGILADYTLGYFGRENTTASLYAFGNIHVQQWTGTNWNTIVTAEFADTTGHTPYYVHFRAKNLTGPVAFKTMPDAGNTPVVLEASVQGADNACMWRLNNGVALPAQFIIERSTDKSNYINLGEIRPQATIESDRNFVFYDQFPPMEPTYYRLKQIWSNGNSLYSNEVMVSRVNTGITPLISEPTIYPNPFTASFTLETKAQRPTNIQVLLTDMSGKALKRIQYQLRAGDNAMRIEQLPGMEAGTYLVDVITESKNFTKKVVKAPN